MNKRNCVIFRRSEKVILHFFKDCAKKVSELMSISPENALKEIEDNITDVKSKLDLIKQ